MPSKKPRAGTVLRILRDPNDLALPGEVVLAIVKVGLEPCAHLYPVFRSDRHVSPVQEYVGVTSQQPAVSPRDALRHRRRAECGALRRRGGLVPVTAQRLLYASVTMMRNVPWPSRG